MFREIVFFVAIPALLISSCATKRYPMAVNLSPEEVALMDCKDLYMEEAKITQTQNQIDDIAGTDWRSVAGFLGDYGMGNAMAKSEAQKALRERAQAVRTTKVQKNCGTITSANQSVGTQQQAPASEIKLAYYNAKIVGVIMSNGEMRSFENRRAIAVPSGISGSDFAKPVTRDGRLIGIITQDGSVVPLEGERIDDSAANPTL